MSTDERAAAPAMPDWAGDPEQLEAPLPDGRARVYYRWTREPEAAERHQPPGERERQDGAPASEPWTPEAQPTDADV
jgi:hypothetical protein